MASANLSRVRAVWLLLLSVGMTVLCLVVIPKAVIEGDGNRLSTAFVCVTLVVSAGSVVLWGIRSYRLFRDIHDSSGTRP